MKPLGIFVLLILLLSSCSGIRSTMDYDEKADFHQYKHFDFYGDMETGLNELDQQRFTNALKQTLQEKGFSSDGKPDFHINFYTKVYEKQNHSSLGIGMGGIGNHIGGGISTGIPLIGTTQVLSITVEFVDAENNQLFWQGLVDGKMKNRPSPKDHIEFLQKMAKNVLKQYPPK